MREVEGDVMTPEEHRDAALKAERTTAADDAMFHATMGILEVLLQMEICGHGTRGFCTDCVRNEFLNHPISVNDQQKCLHHCAHDPRWALDGVCRHMLVVIYPTDEAEECGHRCTFAPLQPAPQHGSAKGRIEMAEDFDAPMELVAPPHEALQGRELLPCPWCGILPIPSSSKHPVGGPATKRKEWYVILHKDSCIGNVIKHLHVAQFNNWNTRAARSVPEQGCNCDKFYEGVRLDFMRALDREDIAIKMLIDSGQIKNRDEWFERYGLPASRPLPAAPESGGLIEKQSSQATHGDPTLAPKRSA